MILKIKMSSHLLPYKIYTVQRGNCINRMIMALIKYNYPFNFWPAPRRKRMYKRAGQILV